MRTITEVSPLNDNIIVRRKATADKEGSIWIPATAIDGRKIHRSGGDYIHVGEVVAVGPGDRLVAFGCLDSGCSAITWRMEDRIWPITEPRTNIAPVPRCRVCDSKTSRILHDSDREEMRAKMPVNVGDTVLYENRKQAEVGRQEFPSFDLDGEHYCFLLAEQHVLAVIDQAPCEKSLAA